MNLFILILYFNYELIKQIKVLGFLFMLFLGKLRS